MIFVLFCGIIMFVCCYILKQYVFDGIKVCEGLIHLLDDVLIFGLHHLTLEYIFLDTNKVENTLATS